jgi:hypothetical protein
MTAKKPVVWEPASLACSSGECERDSLGPSLEVSAGALLVRGRIHPDIYRWMLEGRRNAGEDSIER